MNINAPLSLVQKAKIETSELSSMPSVATSIKVLRFSTFLLVLSFALPLQAHEFEPERLIIIDSSKEEIELLITFREAPGKRLDYLLGIYDKNRDGILSKQESIAISPSLKKIALSGLRSSATLSEVNTRVKYKKREGLSIALFYTFPKTVKSLSFQFTQDKNQIPTSLRFIGPALSLVNRVGPTAKESVLESGQFSIHRR